MSSAGGGSYLDTYLTFETHEEVASGENSMLMDLDQGGEEDGEYPLINICFLRRHAQSNNVSERQVAVKHIVKTLQTVNGDNDAEAAIFEFISSTSGEGRDFSTDQDPLIRAELVEQLPLLCMECYKSKSLFGKVNGIIVPLLVKFLSDQNVQVRKTCQAAILILLEQSLLGSGETAGVFQSEICPVLLRQVEPEGFSDDIRIEAVGLLCKIVTGAFDRDQAVGLFLARYTALCSDQLFHIRKVCASSLGDMSGLLGPELTERVLVPHLVSLSQDSVWGVRKACAEVFTEVSYNCCMATRRNRLAPVFTHLLSDASRWVQSSTFQALGSFISTFADCSRTGLRCIDGQLIYEDPRNRVIDMQKTKTRYSVDVEKEKADFKVPHDVIVPAIDQRPRQRVDSDEDVMMNLNGLLGDLPLTDKSEETAHHPSLEERTEPDGAPAEEKPRLLLKKEDELSFGESSTDSSAAEGVVSFAFRDVSNPEAGEDYSSFYFWGTLPFDPGSSNVCAEGVNSDDGDRNFNEFMRRRVDATFPVISLGTEETGRGLNRNGYGKSEETRNDLAARSQSTVKNAWNLGSERSKAFEDSDSDDDAPLSINFAPRQSSENNLPQADFQYQDIIPQELLDNFLSMVEPSRAQTVESDISRHCAYNIPAVALTMGRQYWPLILPTYRTLAQDMQWKVRRTLAFSLHELAAILGPEVAFRDLLPVFRSFLRDLDEVRIGVLKHLYQFLKLLDKDVRKDLLHHLPDFLQTDNVRNWRFRLLLAEQLIRLCELYDAEDINEYLSPIGMTLAIDKVADIRNKAHKLLATILKHFFEAESKRGGSNMALTNSFILDIIRGFRKSQRSKRRQSFAYICGEIVWMNAVSTEKFVSELLQAYLSLADDLIPNVRISFVQSLSLDFFKTTDSSQQIFGLLNLMSRKDADKDVVILTRQLLGNITSSQSDTNTTNSHSSEQVSTEC